MPEMKIGVLYEAAFVDKLDREMYNYVIRMPNGKVLVARVWDFYVREDDTYEFESKKDYFDFLERNKKVYFFRKKK